MQTGERRSELNTLIDMLELRARDSGEKVAFTFEAQPTSFQMLWQAINQFASQLLDQGLRFEERVVITLPNGPELSCEAAFRSAANSGGPAASTASIPC